MKRLLPAFLIATAACFASASGETTSAADYSVSNEVDYSVRKGLRWLEQHQEHSGGWDSANGFSTTALVLIAFSVEPDRGNSLLTPVIARGYDVLRTWPERAPQGNPDRELEDASLAALALLRRNDASDAARLKKLHQFIAERSTASVSPAPKPPAPSKSAKPGKNGVKATPENQTAPLEMKTIAEALEALHGFDSVEPDSGGRDLAAMKAAIHLIHQKELQPEKLRETPAIHLLCDLLAGAPQDLPQVKATLDQVKQRLVSVTEPTNGNAGKAERQSDAGEDIPTLIEALSVTSAQTIDAPGGRRIDWPRALALRLIDQQNSDGSWLRKGGPDPARARQTAEAVIALEHLLYRL